MKRIIALLISLSLLIIPNLASADVSVYMNKMDEGYGYEFDDDPLNAGGFGPNDTVIRVRPKAARATLIRPRTSFVYEMIKSVEDL